jgi:hypothetical protein
MRESDKLKKGEGKGDPKKTRKRGTGNKKIIAKERNGERKRERVHKYIYMYINIYICTLEYT